MADAENHLPESVGKAFQSELVDLIGRLASNGFAEEYLNSELLSKYLDPRGTPPHVRRQAAIQKWLSAEDNNRKTNLRIPFGEDFGWCHSDEIVAFARELIREVLGPIADVDNLCVSTHTTGASTRLRRSEITAILKHSGQAHATEAARLQWSLAVPGTVLEDQPVETVRGNELFTVPKKSEIDRVSCKEPEINLFLQCAVGNHISRRMKRKGIDLSDQTRNQELARRAVDLGLATVDLSSASDSISRAVVFELLPFEWWSYLDSIRSPECLLDGNWHELEMFSSMGNGFTFELESLIFWALVHSVKRVSRVPGIVSVYGDDIIAPSCLVPRLARVFSWFGFTINTKKSHWTGYFRESCGKHYYRGRDVSPFYIRRPVRTKTDTIRLLNRLMEWNAREWGFIVDEEVAVFHRKWANHIPQELWGGQDPNDITSLVTGHSPKHRLLRVSKSLSSKIRKSGLEVNRLTYWLTAKRESPDFDLEVHPSRQGRHEVVPQPEWIARTSWTPWLVYPDASIPL